MSDSVFVIQGCLFYIPTKLVNYFRHIVTIPRIQFYLVSECGSVYNTWLFLSTFNASIRSKMNACFSLVYWSLLLNSEDNEE